MASYEYRLTFEGLPTPQGEIALRDLVGIGEALQLTATRIARQVGGLTGPGRSTAAIDQMSELRLLGIGSGSTVLDFHLGIEESLPLPGGDEEVVASRFDDVFSAVADNRTPAWADPLVTQAIGRLAARLCASGASKVTADRSADDAPSPRSTIEVASVDLEAWMLPDDRETRQVAVTGVLDKVDLRASRFRVRDDVGHDITLDDIQDVEAAARLIGRRVVASGMAEHDGGRVVRVVEPTLTQEQDRSVWFAVPAAEPPTGGVLVSGGISGVTDDEIDEFLAEIRG